MHDVCSSIFFQQTPANIFWSLSLSLDSIARKPGRPLSKSVEQLQSKAGGVFRLAVRNHHPGENLYFYIQEAFLLEQFESSLSLPPDPLGVAWSFEKFAVRPTRVERCFGISPQLEYGGHRPPTCAWQPYNMSDLSGRAV